MKAFWFEDISSFLWPIESQKSDILWFWTPNPEVWKSWKIILPGIKHTRLSQEGLLAQRHLFIPPTHWVSTEWPTSILSTKPWGLGILKNDLTWHQKTKIESWRPSGQRHLFIPLTYWVLIEWKTVIQNTQTKSLRIFKMILPGIKRPRVSREGLLALRHLFIPWPIESQ